jgi:hypothetical protein
MHSSDLDPENVRSWRLTKAAVFVLIAAGAVVWLILDQRDAARLQELPKTGTAIQGKVTGFESKRGGQYLTVSYEYVVGGATRHADQRRVGDFSGLASGGPVTVFVDPAHPERCVIPNELTHVRFGPTPYLYGGVIVVLMGAAALQARKVLQPARPGDEGD